MAMRLDGSILTPFHSPSEWLKEVRRLQYSAVIFPVDCTAPVSLRRDFQQCCLDNDLLIGEVGAWQNVLDPDPLKRAANIDYNIRQLELAEEIGACCCVNISGSVGTRWDGFHPSQHSAAHYAQVVENTQYILDAVKPLRTAYTLEPMPWMPPDSPEQYAQLLKDVNRPGFKVHLDYCNMINSIERYRESSTFIARCFDLLGQDVVSIHAKDALLSDDGLPLQIREASPGEGTLDMGLILRLSHALGNDMPVFVEHLPSDAHYHRATAYLRAMAAEAGVPVR